MEGPSLPPWTLWGPGWCSAGQSRLSLRPHGLQHASLPCPSLSPGACSDSCPSWRCRPTSSSCHPFRPQSFPAGSFLTGWLFASGGQSTGASAPRALDPALVSCGHLVGTPGRPLKRCPSTLSQLRRLSQRPPQASLPWAVTASSPTVSQTAPGGQAPYRLQVLSFAGTSVVNYLWERHDQMA